MGSSQSSDILGQQQQERKPPIRITGGGNAINPQSGAAPMRHHKHLYLVLGQPKIRYTGHPGRGPLMFHTSHYVGDGPDESVESLEGFPLLGSVTHRPLPPLVVPVFSASDSSSSNAATAKVKFSIDVGPQCSDANVLYVDAFIASSVKFDVHNGGFVIRRPYNPNRPVSPFNTSVATGANAGDGPEGNGKIFSQEIKEGGRKYTFTTCDIPIETFKVVNETKKMEGKNLPVEGCIIFRISWKGKKIGKDGGPPSAAPSENNNNSNNPLAASEGTTTTSVIPAEGEGGQRNEMSKGSSANATTTTTSAANPTSTRQLQEGFSQMISFWEIPDVSKLSFERKLPGVENPTVKLLNKNAEKQALKLKPFTSRYLFTSDAVEGHRDAIFRVDDVYDLAGDDDIIVAPSRAGENPHGRDDDPNNNNRNNGATPSLTRKRKNSNQNGGGEDVSEDDDDDDDGTEMDDTNYNNNHNGAFANNNNNNNANTQGGGDNDDSGNECVVCLTNKKNALLLPCRHLCLCTECAPLLRQQTNKCPVCRAAITKVVAV